MSRLIVGYGAVALATIGTSAYVGYCNAKGIPLEHETALKYGPAIAQAATGGLITTWSLYEAKSAIAEGGLALGFLAIGGLALAGAGALEALVGYGVGYAFGSVN